MDITNKTILITGASGLVGIPAVEKCLEQAEKVIAADIRVSKSLQELEKNNPKRLTIIQTDLTYLNNCEDIFDAHDIDIVLHIAGVKGSPSRTSKSPADYVFPMSMFNMNMIHSSFKAKVDWFVYLSSVGVYAPADIMVEDTVWETMPSKNDWHPGWTKRMGELALDALKIQYGWNKWTVIRPSNIYGRNDNFTPDATVIGANVWKVFNSDTEMICWGDGSPRRDFVYGDDVAQASIDAVKKEVNDIINFGCGEAVSIKDTINLIVYAYEQLTGLKKNIVWDTSKPNGDMLRCLSSEKQKLYNILPSTSLQQGIIKTIESYRNLQN